MSDIQHIQLKHDFNLAIAMAILTAAEAVLDMTLTGFVTLLLGCLAVATLPTFCQDDRMLSGLLLRLLDVVIMAGCYLDGWLL